MRCVTGAIPASSDRTVPIGAKGFRLAVVGAAVIGKILTACTGIVGCGDSVELVDGMRVDIAARS